MDDFWCVRSHPCVMNEQLSSVEFSLSSFRCLSMNKPTTLASEDASVRRRNSSFCDSVSSVPVRKVEPQMHSFALQRWVKTDNASEKKCANNKKDERQEMRKYRERSWTGSPDWDFKEGCSYNVHCSRTYAGLRGGSTLEGNVSSEFISLSSSKSYQTRSKITENSLKNNALGKSSLESIRSGEFSMTDSACDDRASRFNEMPWSTMQHPSSSSLYSPASSKLSEHSSATRVHRTDRSPQGASLESCVRERNERSFLNRVKNEIDTDLFEAYELEHGDDIEDDIESFDDVSIAYSQESSDKTVDPQPRSAIGRVLSLVVGIGAGAIFHVMK